MSWLTSKNSTIALNMGVGTNSPNFYPPIIITLAYCCISYSCIVLTIITLVARVKEKNYVSSSHSKHPPLGHTTSNKYPITSTGVDQQYSYQDEKRRSSVPVLQRQMTQNTLRSL